MNERSATAASVEAPAEGREETLAARDGFEGVRALVGRHQVRWESYFHYRVGEHPKPAPVGFELLLLGTHDHPKHAPQPGCPECVEVYAVLRRVARFVVPPEGRPTHCQILGFEPALLYPSPGHRHVDVSLRVRLLHRVDTSSPVDDCERRCLAEIESNLEQLGARRES